jgi:acetyltransferase-like isoleucine patch superfamily enzyme
LALFEPIRRIKKCLGSPWRLLSAIFLALLRQLDGEIGERARYRYYKRRLRSMGRSVRIDTGVFLYGLEYISIGDNTHIDKNCIIIGSSSSLDLSSRIVKRRVLESGKVESGEVKIGKNCHISQNCMIYGYAGVYIGDNCVMSAGAKIYSLTSMASNPYNPSEVVSIVPYEGVSPTLMGKVVINDNTWIGIDSMISPGLEIGQNSFVRSNSIVLGSFGENSYIAGDPAAFVRHRFESKDAL